MTESRISSLYWVNEGTDHPLQPWARYFLRLGQRLAAASVGKGLRIHAAFALPVLDHCSVLAAVGVVTERANTTVVSGENRERFEILKNLPPGHPVRVLRLGRLFVGEIDTDTELRNGETIPVLVSNVEKNGSENGTFREGLVKAKLIERMLCRPRNCMTFEPSDTATATNQRQRGLKIIEHPLFLSKALESVPVEKLCLGSRMDYAIIGIRSRVLADAEMPMAIADGHRKRIVGDAYDIIRLKEGPRDFRGAIVSTTAREPRIPKEPPGIAIFDGASGYLKYRDRFPTSHQLVLLDRSEVRFLEATNQLNREYVQRADDAPAELTNDAPPGVDHISFIGRQSC